MTASKEEENSARPCLCRAFVSRVRNALRGVSFRPRPPAPAAQILFWSTAAVGIVLDLWTKKAVFEYLRHKPDITIIDGLVRLVMVENPGAAFGIADGQRYLLMATSVIALIIIFGILFSSRARQNLLYVVLGLLTAGVCGNLYDRIFNDGLVRDFIDVYYRQWHWPAFNVADSMLCIGVGLIIISSFRRSKRPS